MLNIKRPTIIIDKQKCMSNIDKMASKAKKSDVIFRPHFKTHQSTEVGEWFRQFGIDKICVSSVEMGILFAKHGWDDISIAFPFNPLQIDEINRLAGEIKLQLLVESIEILDFLDKNLENKAGIFIEIDTGYHRSGVSNDEIEKLDSMIQVLDKSRLMDFQGFLVHAGNTYQVDSPGQVKDIFFHTADQLQNLKQRYKSIFPNLLISVGDTPACSILDDLSGVDEIRPGNFIYYDVMQYELGACGIDDIAAIVACPVVAKNKDRCEIVIYGGAVHLSKESLITPEGQSYYGLVVQLNDDAWETPLAGTSLISISQEHGIIRTQADTYNSINRGDILGIMPIHSCLANNLMLDHRQLINERY